MGERPDRPPWWTVVVRVAYASAAFLGSAAAFVTALNGWDRI